MMRGGGNSAGPLHELSMRRGPYIRFYMQSVSIRAPRGVSLE